MMSSLYSWVLRGAVAITLIAGILSAHGQGNSVLDPIADQRAVVVEGHARFTVLTSQLIRMEWSSDGKFIDAPSFVFLNRHLAVPQFTASAEGEGAGRLMTLRTADLTLTYKPNAGEAGRFDANNLDVSLTLNGEKVSWRPGMQDTGNLLGTTRTLDGANGEKTREPLEVGLVSRNGWAVVDDSKRPLFDSGDFSFKSGEESTWPWVVQHPEGQAQDLYFFGYGHNYRKALGDYVQVAGRIPLPPRFAFGAWWSRYWSYSDQELSQLVDDFKANSVPLDVLVMDMGWHPNFFNERNAKDQAGEHKGWTGYSWNKLLFPDPQRYLDHMHQQGLKTTLNLHPAGGVEPWEDQYPAMARAMGIDPKTDKYVPFDITNKKFAQSYMNILHHPLEKQGIDFWWLDWQQKQATPIPGVNTTWWLNYVHFTDQQREGKRPLIFHRWGGLGNHRYQIGFSGDVVSVWPSLGFQPWFTATSANVGYAYWSHDIGGHVPGKIDPELYTRWIQFGAFSPILRTHTTSNPEAERRIWAYPEPFADIMRETFRRRYALQPYIYTEARRTYDTGVAFMHPLYYDWPEAPEAYSAHNEYMFGDSMLLAPVTAPVDPKMQLAAESIWLPRGPWIEWSAGRHFAGGETVKSEFSISEVPIYVRPGSIVPMQPAMAYTGEKPVDPLIVTVFPLAAGQRSAYEVYEDSGKAEEYKTTATAWTKLTASQANQQLDLTIEPVRGGYVGMPERRGYEIRLPLDWPPVEVLVNGAPIAAVSDETPGWHFDGNSLSTVVRVGQAPVHNAVHITIRRKNLPPAERYLDGFPGLMRRAREADESISHAGYGTTVPDSLIDLMQAGDRISYHPETTLAEISALRSKYEAALVDLKKLIDDATQSKDTSPSWDTHKTALNRAFYLVRQAGEFRDATGTK